MKRILTFIICLILVFSMLVSCAVTDYKGGSSEKNYSVTSSETTEKYMSLLKDRAGDSLSGNYVIGDETDAAEYGVSLEGFNEDGYIIRSIGDETVILGKTDKGLDRAVRYYTNYCIDSNTDVNVVYGEGYKVKKLTIGGNDISEYSIYLFEGADECHTFAAQTLRDYIGSACGVYPEIVREKPSGHMIALVQDVTGAHGDEEFTIAVKNGDLIITGGRYRGCMYGVYEFLEAYVGWRFLYDLEFVYNGILHPYYDSYSDAIIDYLYESEHVEVPEGISDHQKPSFDYRRASPRGSSMANAEDYDLKRKANGDPITYQGYSKYNAYGMTIAASHGIQMNMKKQLYDEFGIDVGGQQPCYTDEAFIALAEEVFGGNVENRIARGERIGYEITTIDVAMCDNDGFCTCKNCRKYYSLDKAGNLGPVLYFTNRMADVFGEKYPELKVTMLVYYVAKRPPAVTVPRDNVQISYCFYYASQNQVPCAAHGLSGVDCKEGSISNITEAEYIEKWCEITDDIVVWYYPGTWYFNSMPSSYLYALLEDMRYLKSLGKIEGIYSCPSYSMYGDGIIAYLLRCLMWDCDVTDEEYDEMIREYCNIMYGNGGKYIYEFLQFKEAANHDGCWSNFLFSGPHQRINFNMYGENADYVTGLFDSAIKYADTELQAVRAENLSLSAYFIISVVLYDDEYTNGTAEQRAKYSDRWNTFLDNVKKYGFVFDLYYSTDHEMPDFPFDKADLSVNPGSLFTANTGWWDDWWHNF